MIAIDTDVLAVHHIFHNDPRYETTRDFFARIEGRPWAITVFNLLELSGIFASANKVAESKAVFEKYLRAGKISILFPVLTADDARHFWQGSPLNASIGYRRVCASATPQSSEALRRTRKLTPSSPGIPDTLKARHLSKS